MLQGSPRPLSDHGLALCSCVLLHPFSLCSLLPGCRWGERLPGAAKAHGKYTSSRHCKACQNLAPGHRIVYSGRLYSHQPASWQWFLCVFAVSQRVLVPPYFLVYFKSSLPCLKCYGISFSTVGYRSVWSPRGTHKCGISVSKELLLFLDHQPHLQLHWAEILSRVKKFSVIVCTPTTSPNKWEVQMSISKQKSLSLDYFLCWRKYF